MSVKEKMRQLLQRTIDSVESVDYDLSKAGEDPSKVDGARAEIGKVLALLRELDNIFKL